VELSELALAFVSC